MRIAHKILFIALLPGWLLFGLDKITDANFKTEAQQLYSEKVAEVNRLQDVLMEATGKLSVLMADHIRLDSLLGNIQSYIDTKEWQYLANSTAPTATTETTPPPHAQAQQNKPEEPEPDSWTGQQQAMADAEINTLQANVLRVWRKYTGGE